MEVEVVSLGERSTEEVLRWRVANRSQVASIHWEHLALDLVRRARSGRKRIGEIYFCYRGERIGEYYDHDLLETLITVSCDHAWGSSIYVVLDSWEPGQETTNDYLASREEWLRTALRTGVTDFLQVRMDPSGLEPVDSLLLRSACDRARSITETLGSVSPHGVWEVALAGGGRYREQCGDFLGSFVRANGPANPEAHLLILVHDLVEASNEDLVEDTLRRFQPTRATVAKVGLGRPAAVLSEYCQRQGLGLVWYRGFYELKYFLLRRCSPGGSPRVGRGTRALAATSRAADEFTYYECRLREVFRRIGPEHPRFSQALVYEERLKGNLRKARKEDTDTLMAQRAEIVDRWNELALAVLGVPFNWLCDEGSDAATHEAREQEVVGSTLLVTTSLDPASHQELCLLAARITGRLLKEIPPSVQPVVHLAITRSALGDLIDGVPAVAGWIFLGLAADERGLQEASSGDFVLAEEWSACFGGLGGSLPVALLLAGRSADAARWFADRGVAACALGFERPVLAADFAHLARRVLLAILNGQEDSALVETIVLQSSQGGALFAART